MKRTLIKAPGEVVVDERPAPTPGPGEYLIATRACGLCTVEQRVFRGATSRYPFAGGHEVGGVVATGPAGGLDAGTVVAVSLLPRCGRCDACASGLDNLCAYLTSPGSSEGPGGLSEYVVAGERDVAPVEGASPLEASLVEPLACVLNSLSVAGIGEGSRLAVLGNGFMGVLHARAAAALGAEATLVATGPEPAGLQGAWEGPRRESDSLAAEALAARFPSHSDEDFDAAIVIRDMSRTAVAAAHLVRPGGIVSVYASPPGGEDVGLPSQLLRRKRLTLTAAASHRAVDFATSASLVSNRSVAVDDLVHRTYPVDEAQEALTYASEVDSGRVAITFDAAAEGMPIR